RRRANAKRSATEKGPAKDDDILWVSRDERCPPDSAATHVFNGAFSAADLFNRALPRAGVYEDANATSNEQFIRASASNDNEHSDSFVNRSRSTAFWSGTRAGFTHNWKGTAFQGRQYGAFRNYQSQWHDSGWWRHNCDRIIFVSVYSQPFPFFFDSGYWYPCWGYYPDSYYPYDGPIYGYNDLSPDQ